MESKPTDRVPDEARAWDMRGTTISSIEERLVELRRHLDHLRDLRPRGWSAAALRRNLSLHNDTLFSLLAVSQLVVGVAGGLSARRGLPFENDAGAMRNLLAYPEIEPELAGQLEALSDFRKVLIRELGAVDLERVVEELGRLDLIERFLAAVRNIEAAAEERGTGVG